VAAVDFTGVQHIVVDIEGTTSASAYVYDVLFPYATERFRPWLEHHGDEPETAVIIRQVGEEIGRPLPSVDDVVAVLGDWVAEDRKATPLKTLQGLIWQEGFSTGDLRSHFFDDALEALNAWHARGMAVSVYSSGSVLAQRNWYTHSERGDLSGWITDYFDTANAGPKRERTSYDAIARALAVDPRSLLFCSDVVAELDAAEAAGWQVVRVRREGEPHASGDSTYPEVESMTDIRVI
jgi:enolase-phosphatase E1